MKRTLSKEEKTVLRLIIDGAEGCPEEYPADRYAGAVKSLERQGLVKAMYEDGGCVAAVAALIALFLACGRLL